MTIVEPLYVPKSVTMHQSGDRFFVTIASPTLLSVLISIVAIFAILFILPFVAVFAPLMTLLIFAGLVALIIYLFRKGGPTMTISAQGVEIGDKMYRYEDIQDFREGADDSWLTQVIKFTQAEFLGIQYGIYSVRTPYILTKVESVKVAPYLTRLLQHASADIGKERERKIQQAENF